MRRDISELNRVLREIRQIDIQQLDNDIESIHRLVIRLQDTHLDPLSRAILSTDREVGRVTNQYQALASFFDNVYGDVRNLTRALNILDTVVNDIDGDLSSLNRSLITVNGSLSSRVEQLVERNAQCKNNTEEVNQTVVVLTSGLEQLKVEQAEMNETLVAAVHTLMDDTAILRNRTADLEQSLNLTSMQLKLQSNRTEKQADLEPLQSNVANIRSDLDTLNATMTGEIARLEGLLSALNSRSKTHGTTHPPDRYNVTSGWEIGVGNTSLPSTPSWPAQNATGWTTISPSDLENTNNNTDSVWAIIERLQIDFQQMSATVFGELSRLNETLVEYKAAASSDSDAIEQNIYSVNSTVVHLAGDVQRNNQTTEMLINDLVQRIVELERKVAVLENGTSSQNTTGV